MAWLCRNELVLRGSSNWHRWNVYGEGCLASGARVTGGNCWVFRVDGSRWLFQPAGWVLGKSFSFWRTLFVPSGVSLSGSLDRDKLQIPTAEMRFQHM